MSRTKWYKCGTNRLSTLCYVGKIIVTRCHGSPASLSLFTTKWPFDIILSKLNKKIIMHPHLLPGEYRYWRLMTVIYYTITAKANWIELNWIRLFEYLRFDQSARVWSLHATLQVAPEASCYPSPCFQSIQRHLVYPEGKHVFSCLLYIHDYLTKWI